MTIEDEQCQASYEQFKDVQALLMTSGAPEGGSGLFHPKSKDVERGPYRSADEFVEQAVQTLHEQEQWLADHHADIAAKIEKGHASCLARRASRPGAGA